MGYWLELSHNLEYSLQGGCLHWMTYTAARVANHALD